MGTHENVTRVKPPNGRTNKTEAKSMKCEDVMTKYTLVMFQSQGVIPYMQCGSSAAVTAKTKHTET